MIELYEKLEDVFETSNQTYADIVTEYYTKNKEKAELEKWLKGHRSNVIEALEGKNAGDFGNIRVTMVTPVSSKFNEDKVVEFLKLKGIFHKASKEVLDSDKLSNLVELGEVDIDELTEYAWEEKPGSPRLTLKEVPVNE